MTHIPHFNATSAPWRPQAGFGGHEAVLYRSPDHTRVAATYRESGTFTLQMPYDQFVYVIAGTATITVEGAGGFVAGPGDAFYVRQGMNVTWELSEDFHDICVMISDTPIS